MMIVQITFEYEEFQYGAEVSFVSDKACKHRHNATVHVPGYDIDIHKVIAVHPVSGKSSSTFSRAMRATAHHLGGRSVRLKDFTYDLHVLSGRLYQLGASMEDGRVASEWVYEHFTDKSYKTVAEPLHSFAHNKNIIILDVEKEVQDINDDEYKDAVAVADALDVRVHDGEGAKRLVSVLHYGIIPALRSGHVLFLEHPDAYLHPVVMQGIVRMFYESDSNAQLVFTTYNAAYLDGGLITPDQIYIAERDEVYALLEYKFKEGESLLHGYLLGRYGGTPSPSPSLALNIVRRRKR